MVEKTEGDWVTVSGEWEGRGRRGKRRTFIGYLGLNSVCRCVVEKAGSKAEFGAS